MIRQTRHNKLFLYLIILLGFIGGYIYYSQVEIDTLGIVPIQESNLDKLENISIDFDVLDSPTFQELKIFGEYPVLPGVTGKNNIFAPIIR